MVKKKKTWSARFNNPTSNLMHKFNESFSFDQRLIKQEIQASIAHAKMLGHCKIITKKDSTAIVTGLKKIAKLYRDNKLNLNDPAEDVHSFIENKLTKLIGTAGKKLHTARSRNDQVSTVLRMWLKEEINSQAKLIIKLRLALLTQANKHINAVMPGYTHLQVAQPTTLAHHLHAYSCMLARDYERLLECYQRVNVLPLGAAALAGTSFKINPKMVAKELGFTEICSNSMDAVADRDFVIEYANLVALSMVHLSRLGEELVLWASPAFNFVTIADEYSTGSSIMPQKRNPDAAELIRGKASRTIGNVVSLLTLIKSQALTYNKDNQEDKELVFDSVDTYNICLAVTEKMIATCKFNIKNMRKACQQGYATATELADLLVKHKIPFREAHARVAKTVNFAEKNNLNLEEIPGKEITKLTGLSISKVKAVLSIDKTIANRASFSSPKPSLVAKKIATEIKELNKELRRISKN